MLVEKKREIPFFAKNWYMRGIKATNLEYKESLVQAELKIDLSKLRH